MTNPSEPYDGLIERLRARRQDRSVAIPYKGEWPERLTNPDGPEAAEALSRLTRDVEEAKEALRPFAEALANCVDDDALDRDNIWEAAAAMEITVGDLRRASATLTRLSRTDMEEGTSG